MKTKGRSIKVKQDLAIAEELQKAGIAPYLVTTNEEDDEKKEASDKASVKALDQNEKQATPIKYRFMINNSREAFS